MPTYGLYLSTLVHEFIGIYVRKLSILVLIIESYDLIRMYDLDKVSYIDLLHLSSQKAFIEFF